MPGYKQTEAGVIPEDWECTNVRDIASPIRNAIVGGPFGSDLVSSDYVEDGIPVVRGQNVGSRFVSGSFAFVTKAKASSLEANLARPTDLIFTQRGTLGQVSLVPDQPYAQYLVSQSQMKLTVNRRAADPLFFYYVFSSPQQQEQIRKNTIQTGVPHINLAILRSVPVQRPLLAEQEAIAEALSHADALIESLEQLLAKKRRLRQGAMQDLLTGRTRLPGFSGEWEVKPLGDLFDFSRGFTASRDQLSSEGYCYLHYGDIHTSKRSFVDVRAEHQDLPKLAIPLRRVSAVSLLDDGDVVFVDASEDDMGTSKHVVIINPGGMPFISGLHTIVAKGKTKALENQYRRYCFQTTGVKAQFRFFAVGTKVSGISKSNIARVTLPVPSGPEQTAIAAILSDMDEEIAALEAKLAKARQVKQGMMQELLTGRIRLVRPVSSVGSVSVAAAPAPTTARSHNWQINEAVVISVLAKHFGSEQFPLGRKRYTKLSYLLHRHVEGRPDGYLKKAAGPYNPETKYKGPEGIAVKNCYVRRHSRGRFTGFVAAERSSEAEGYFSRWYRDDVLPWLEQFRRRSNDELELLATVDMAMEDLRRSQKPVELATVKQVIQDHPEWEAKLDRAIFSDENIHLAIKSCRQLLSSEIVDG